MQFVNGIDPGVSKTQPLATFSHRSAVIALLRSATGMPDIDRRQFLTVPPVPRVPVEGYWLHVSRSAMACRFEVTLPAGIFGGDAGVKAAQLALDEVERLEQQLSVFRETSEVSAINRQARLEDDVSRKPIRLESSLFHLILQCVELHRETEGCFDITSGPLSRCWGFLRRQGRMPGPGRDRECARTCRDRKAHP